MKDDLRLLTEQTQTWQPIRLRSALQKGLDLSRQGITTCPSALLYDLQLSSVR